MPSQKVSTAASGKKPRKRRANVYDSVAGNVTQAGLIGHVTGPKAAKKRLRPDEVLFKRKNAPIRYEEDDYYPAHNRLSAHQLPRGELSTSIHAYITHMYAQVDARGRNIRWRHLDGTVLLALGILLEETARSVIGETGDLAFTEADQGNGRGKSKSKSKPTSSAVKEHEPVDATKQSTKETNRGVHASWASSAEDSTSIAEETD
ncbi:hypothetical protein COCC4DRAFT_66626 [Bipolaris maydis ATCC 48331]|uniref:Uncharacterized protein n=2 Tax=Cochliobolus heterostrophus TaxID=5016 RepID=M2TTM6_COCH5|nr:uncharacterized protein COCC4DRAFT_66626 [Bipolaris maydis ATCC 48331]EMD85131.1 hypothetical protein COCHEDRAFT_1149491 [Bipolaris maydis C5]ENH99205.1 hypothetical protein COCC4DRAFT_66626 [Bipolaris maydis ATCC 48331]KAJ6267771.1 hypothetical protein PSV08DRAFT_321627 [Bipolaris maydis]